MPRLREWVSRVHGLRVAHGLELLALADHRLRVGTDLGRNLAGVGLLASAATVAMVAHDEKRANRAFKIFSELLRFFRRRSR
jgi:hypothetical protein